MKRLFIHRVVQLVGTSLKYSGASVIQVIVEWDQSEVNFMVNDNGKVYDQNLVKEGIGLFSIKT